MAERTSLLRVGDPVVIELETEGHGHLEGELTAFKGHNAIIKLTSPHTSEALTGQWLRITRGNGHQRWQDPVNIVDVRLYPRSPRLVRPWGNNRLTTRAILRRR
jgi:hypothetical protein